MVEADPGRAFTFECSQGDVHYATWGYRIEPTDGGCRVTEWTENLLPESALMYGVKISGVEDRPGKNREMPVPEILVENEPSLSGGLAITRSRRAQKLGDGLLLDEAPPGAVAA